VCEKIAQTIFININALRLPQGKSSPELLPTYFSNFQKTAQSYQSPKRRNFAQSGHPDRNLILKEKNIGGDSNLRSSVPQTIIANKPSRARRSGERLQN
jgi:hypothetical protein